MGNARASSAPLTLHSLSLPLSSTARPAARAAGVVRAYKGEEAVKGAASKVSNDEMGDADTFSSLWPSR